MSYAEGKYEDRVECKTTSVWVPLDDNGWKQLERFSSGVPTFDDMLAASLTDTGEAPYIPPLELPGVSISGGQPAPSEVPLPPAAGVFILGAIIAALAFKLMRFIVLARKIR
jgi:hypothetical protein